MLRCGVKVTTALFIGLMVYQLMAVTWNRLTHPHYKNKPAAKEMRKAMRKRLQKMGVLEEFEKYQARSNNGGGWVLIGGSLACWTPDTDSVPCAAVCSPHTFSRLCGAGLLHPCHSTVSV